MLGEGGGVVLVGSLRKGCGGMGVVGEGMVVLCGGWSGEGCGMLRGKGVREGGKW